MANMSYVRFQNTVTDLRDCYEHIDNENLSKEENRARTHLVTVCRQIAALFDDEADDSFEELEARIATLHAALTDSQERNRQIAAELAMLKGENAQQAQTILYLTAQCQECVEQLSEGRTYSEGCNP